MGGGEAGDFKIFEGGDAADLAVDDGELGLHGGAGGRFGAGFLGGAEGEGEFAELDEVAGFDDGFGDAGAVDVGAVARAEVADPPAAEGIAEHFGVASGDGVGFEGETGVAGAADEEVLAVDLVARVGAGGITDFDHERTGSHACTDGCE